RKNDFAIKMESMNRNFFSSIHFSFPSNFTFEYGIKLRFFQDYPIKCNYIFIDVFKDKNNSGRKWTPRS
ncbi:MAG: hypothetical protein DWQ02_18515, partial [Bacteroidetes bacterium]